MVITFCFLFAGVSATSVSAQEPIPRLELGKPIQRPLAGGESHTFQVPLTAGQFLHVLVDQRGIDVVLKLGLGDGQILVEADSPNNTQGPEAASIIAEQPGLYQVQVSSYSRETPAGQYELRIEALRPATDQDRKWIEAQSAYVEAQRLRRQETAESLPAAIRRYEDAILNWQAGGDRLMEAHARLCIGAAWRRLGKSQNALESYAQALGIQQGAESWRESANTLFLIGAAQNDLGESRKALEYFSLALERQQAMADLYAEAQTLSYTGLAYRFLGETRKALEYYNRVLPVWQRINNRRQVAETHHNIGRVYESSGEFQKAIELYNQALSAHRVLLNRNGQAEELNSLGFVHGLLGEWPKALEFYRQALVLWRATVDRRKEGILLGNIGFAYASQNERPKALENYQQALNLLRAAQDRRAEGLTLERMGLLYATSGEPGKALALYEQALSLRRATNDRAGEASTLGSIGAAHLLLGEVGKAVDFLTQSLAIYREVGNRVGETTALYDIARAERARGNPDAALKQIDAALSFIETARTGVGSQQLRASYLAKVQQYYELNIDLLMRQHLASPAKGFDAQALQTSERARARGLLEMLTEAHADIRRGVDAGLLDRERELAQQINAKAALFIRPDESSLPAARVEVLKKELSQLETDYEQVQASIRSASPRYAALSQPKPLSLAEIQSQLLDSDSLLLEYSLGEERSFLWAVTADSIASYELPKRELIEKAAKQVNELLTARGTRQRGETAAQRGERVAKADAQLPEAARQLSEMVLAPAAAKLAGNRLIIVADGALQYVPFAMLPVTTSSGETVPLVVQNEVVTLPSASTLAVMRQELKDRSPAPKQLAVFADPVFSRNDERSRTSLARPARKPGVKAAGTLASRGIVHEEESALKIGGRTLISRLPFTRQEAERILAITPDSANLKALDFRANRALATGAELSQYRYLHFATHGLLDTERPILSALVLSLVDEQGKPVDGFLRAHEIYNLNLPAELVVLSACQTGLGKEFKGEGLVGLTRGFMYAGAARVVVSLWNVNDQATSELMARLYQKMLKEGQRPAAALRSAQVEMWRQRQWQAPYYWAAFVLQGEWK